MFKDQNNQFLLYDIDLDLVAFVLKLDQDMVNIYLPTHQKWSVHVNSWKS